MANRRIANFPFIHTMNYKLSTTGVEPGLRWYFLNFLKDRSAIHAFKYRFYCINYSQTPEYKMRWSAGRVSSSVVLQRVQ